VNRFVSSLLLLVFLEWPPPVLFLMRSFWHGAEVSGTAALGSPSPLASSHVPCAPPALSLSSLSRPFAYPWHRQWHEAHPLLHLASLVSACVLESCAGRMRRPSADAAPLALSGDSAGVSAGERARRLGDSPFCSNRESEPF
jgi:hypothetical protein